MKNKKEPRLLKLTKLKGSIISVVGKITVGIMELLLLKKSPIRPIMKSNQTIIRKNLMEQLNFITNLLGIKDPNITILDYVDAGTHKEIIAKLDYPAPKCPHCQGQMV